MAASRPVKVLAVAAVAVVVLPGLLYAMPQLAGRDGAYLVLSGSMTPFFLPGDVIFVDTVDAASLQVGDVVTFKTSLESKTLVTHRVSEVLSDGGRIRYRSWGDANEEPDPFIVKQEMVVGKYAFHIPYWGLLTQVIKGKVGFALLIGVPAAILVGREFRTLYRELDAWDRERERRRGKAKGAR